MLLQSTKFPVLFSYANVVGTMKWAERDIRWVMENPNWDVMLDSGAFTAYRSGLHIDLDEYCAFVDQWKHKLWGYVALDVPFNSEASVKNLEYMWDKGYEPIPVHVVGDEQPWMDTLFEHSRLVAVGSLSMRERMTPRNRSFIKMKMEWAEGRPIHWLGYTHEGMVATFQPYSCDSSSWMSSGRFGDCMVYLGNGRKLKLVRGDRHVYDENKEAIDRQLTRVGTTPGALLDSSRWSGVSMDNPAVLLSTWSWVQYVRELAERFGTRYFLVIPMAGWANMLSAVLQKAGGEDYPLLHRRVLGRGQANG